MAHPNGTIACAVARRVSSARKRVVGCATRRLCETVDVHVHLPSATVVAELGASSRNTAMPANESTVPIVRPIDLVVSLHHSTPLLRCAFVNHVTPLQRATDGQRGVSARTAAASDIDDPVATADTTAVHTRVKIVCSAVSVVATPRTAGVLRAVQVQMEASESHRRMLLALRPCVPIALDAVAVLVLRRGYFLRRLCRHCTSDVLLVVHLADCSGTWT